MFIVLIVLSGLIITCIGLALSDWKEDNTPRTPEQIQADIADIHGVSVTALQQPRVIEEAEHVAAAAWYRKAGEA